MLKNWLKIAFKNYRKNWVSTLINLFGLTVGLTGFILMLMHLKDEASYESWNPKKENIYFVQPYYNSTKSYGDNLSYPIASHAVELISDVEDFVLFNGYGYANKFSANGKSVFQENGARTSGKFFEFFPFKLLSGSYDNVLKDENAIAISSELSMNLFGDNKSSGKTLNMDGKPCIITAVYEKPKENTQVKPDYVMLSESIKSEKEAWGHFNYKTLFKIKKGADIGEVKKQLYNKIFLKRAEVQGSSSKGMTTEKFLEMYGPNGAELTRLDRINLHSKGFFIKKADYESMFTMLVLSVLILILSAINFINLKTAQASQRAKEVGVRKAIGSTRISLIFQFFLETFLLCLVAYALSFVLTELLLTHFNKFYEKNIQLNDLNSIAISFAVVILISLFSGIIPALYLSKFKPINTLKGNFSQSNQGIWLRNGILTLQFVISSFFIIGSLIINSQLKYMMNKDLGFNGNQIINIQFMDWSEKEAWRKYERLKTEIKKIKGVEQVNYGEASPASNSFSISNIDYRDKTLNAQHGSMDYGYLDFMGIKLMAGRDLDPKLSSDTISSILVNETLVKGFGWTNQEAIGKKVKPGFDYKDYKIIGVVKDYHTRNLEEKVGPVVFFHYLTTNQKRYYIYNIQVKINKDNIPKTIDDIQDFWESKVEKAYPFQYYFLNQKFADTYKRHVRQRVIYLVLNVMVLIIALLGLFALSALMIEQKLKTVAIKKTLGASDKSLIFGLTKQFLTITAVAVLISIPISYYFMNEWLKDFAYRIEMPWFPYVLSFVILQTLTFVVVSIKAYRATQISLVKYLKHE